MPPETNHSQSSAPYSLELLADVDILAKSVDKDFVPVSDVVLFKSFDVPSGVSLNDLSKGTLVHRLVSDVAARPSDRWWVTALDIIHKHVPHEMEPAACAAEIYLARVAQAHIDAGHAQLDYIESRDSGMEFIDSPENNETAHSEVELLAVVKQDVTSASVPQSAVDGVVAEVAGLPMSGTKDVPTGEGVDITAGGPITDATGKEAITWDGTSSIVFSPTPSADDAAISTSSDDVVKDGEEIQHDNVMGAAMGGLGLAGDGELSATLVEEDKAKKGLLSDIELIRQKIDESDRLRALLEKVEALTGEQDAIKRVEEHIHPSSHAITASHDNTEMKAGGT